MKGRPGRISVRIILILVLLYSLPGVRVRSTTLPNPDQTILEVREASAQPTWVTSRTIHALHALTFRWKTDVAMTNYGQWQLLDYPPPPQDLMAQPFAQSNVGPAPLVGQFANFTIDLAALQQQYPNKIPPTPPAQAKDYYLRLVPWKTPEMTDPNNVAGKISINVKITYVKSAAPPPVPPKFEYLTEFSIGGHYVTIAYGTNKPVVPTVRIYEYAPGYTALVSEYHPPASRAYDDHGEVELKGLTPKTNYRYEMEVKDEKGQTSTQNGKFTSAIRYAIVGFDRIHMIDDSDGFPAGAGDLVFAFFANDRNVLGMNEVFPKHDSLVFPSGKIMDFDHIFGEIKDPPDTITVRVNGVDWDNCGPPLALNKQCICNRRGGDGAVVTDSHMKNHTCGDGSAEMSAATMTLNVPQVKDRSQFGVEFFQRKFEMIGDNGRLKFKVVGRLDVEYR